MYLYLKAFHIIAVIAWMAGMLYLPRLFVYHCGAAPGSQQSETFKLMERRLLKLIINPAMIAAWALGLTLIWLMGKDAFLAAGWLHAKLALVALLLAHFIVAGRWLKGVEKGRALPSAKALRWFNELPVLLLVGVVYLVLAKPF